MQKLSDDGQSQLIEFFETVEEGNHFSQTIFEKFSIIVKPTDGHKFGHDFSLVKFGQKDHLYSTDHVVEIVLLVFD